MADQTLDLAPIWDDLSTFDGHAWRGLVDVVAAGYPCQPFSTAGRRRGVDDERHLWSQVARIIGECRPGLVFLENVPNHLRLGFREVAGDLRSMGYGIEAGLFSAAEVGAPHLRKRLFVLAYNQCGLLWQQSGWGQGNGSGTGVIGIPGAIVADDSSERGELRFLSGGSANRDSVTVPERNGASLAGEVVHADFQGLQGWRKSVGEDIDQFPAWPPSPEDIAEWRRILAIDPTLEPALRGVADGLAPWMERSYGAGRSDRLRLLGNGVVPLTVALAFTTLARRIAE
jgi:DNA (cytosine-5)-methyltransferase 1